MRTTQVVEAQLWIAKTYCVLSEVPAHVPTASWLRIVLRPASRDSPEDQSLKGDGHKRGIDLRSVRHIRYQAR